MALKAESDTNADPNLYRDSQHQSLKSSSSKESKARKNSNKLNESLDPSYTVRNRDYMKFFKVGKIFSTLWTEGSSGGTTAKDSFVSEVIYGEQVHSKIRRFVVIRKSDRSCTCLPILSYKPGPRKSHSINLEEHGIIYSHTKPKPIEGVRANPIRVQSTKNGPVFREYSLVDYSRPYTVEMNVKVKDVGSLDADSRQILVANFTQIFFGSAEETLSPSALTLTRVATDRLPHLPLLTVPELGVSDGSGFGAFPTPPRNILDERGYSLMFFWLCVDTT
jgi:hypothetical protein